jgi:hypothetical protein
MTSQQLNLHNIALPPKPDHPSGKATTIGVWILTATLYLLMGATLYLIWQKANQG